MKTASHDTPDILAQAELPTSLQETGELHPEMFYPSVLEDELTMWTHWLPTAFVFKYKTQVSRQAFLNRLERLGAPQEVVEECQWAWNMDLFDA